MNVLQIGILVFVIIEIMNVSILYLKPESRIGNGVGVFNCYHQAMKDESHKEFITYLVNWVAGAKLIFIMLSLVIVFLGSYQVQLFTIFAFIISISSFYIKLYPIIKRLDQKGKVTPVGYHKTLELMITGMIIGFVVILLINFFL